MIVRGARVVTPGRDLGVADVRIENGVIAEVAAKVSPTAGERVIEADGLTLLPGFVDIHSHGRGGADFCDATDAAFDKIGRGKLADGVTGFLATGLTRPEEDLAEMCAAAERYRKRGGGAACLGVHLEGPFFNAEMAGAQNPAYLKKPDAAFVKRLDAISPVKKVSLAPELEGAEKCIRELSAAGIVTSGGHSSADYETFERARKAGMMHLTHFCNAMMPIHHLRPTMVTGGLLADDVFVEIITDGVHLSDPRRASRTDCIRSEGCASRSRRAGRRLLTFRTIPRPLSRTSQVPSRFSPTASAASYASPAGRSTRRSRRRATTSSVRSA